MRCVCLRCGATKRGKKPRYDCKCGYYLAPISGKMLPIAKLLHNIGFKIASATESIDLAAEGGIIKLILVKIEFDKYYDAMVFSDTNLPGDYRYVSYLSPSDVLRCRIICTEMHIDTLWGATSNQNLKQIIAVLRIWARDLGESGAAACLQLGGWI